jgi:hypothetical protein
MSLSDNPRVRSLRAPWRTVGTIKIVWEKIHKSGENGITLLDLMEWGYNSFAITHDDTLNKVTTLLKNGEIEIYD